MLRSSPLNGAMTKWPVHKQAHRTTQKQHLDTKTQQTFRKKLFVVLYGLIHDLQLYHYFLKAEHLLKHAFPYGNRSIYGPDG